MSTSRCLCLPLVLLLLSPGSAAAGSVHAERSATCIEFTFERCPSSPRVAHHQRHRGHHGHRAPKPSGPTEFSFER